jgi:hypothetical protein
MIPPAGSPRLLDQVRNILPMMLFALKTEQAYAARGLKGQILVEREFRGLPPFLSLRQLIPQILVPR